MASGKRLFQGNDKVEILAAVVQRELPISTLNPKIPAPLHWIIARCLAKEPNQRFAPTADLQNQLSDLRAHMAEMLSSETWRHRFRCASAAATWCPSSWDWQSCWQDFSWVGA
jgi:hypothetical protein